MDKNLQNSADFQPQIELLKERLLTMGSEVEGQARSAVRSLVDRDLERAEKTFVGMPQLMFLISKLTSSVLS